MNIQWRGPLLDSHQHSRSLRHLQHYHPGL